MVAVAGASRSVYVSHPKEFADVIESAARAVSKCLGLRKESHPQLQMNLYLEEVTFRWLSSPPQIRFEATAASNQNRDHKGGNNENTP
jgi:hypothetical protein